MKKILKSFFLFICFLGQPSCSEAAPPWQKIEEGIEYLRIDTKQGEFSTQFTLHAFRIDPKNFRFDLVNASDYSSPKLTAREFSEKSGALLVINGSFFDESAKPLGLLVQNKKLIQTVRNTEWGVFLMEGGKPFITHRRDFGINPTTEMALQTGPRLVVNGTIPRLKEAIPSRRSLVAITPDNKVILAVTGSTITETQDLAQLVARKENKGGLGVSYALNLDGGGSTQLYLTTSSFTYHFAGDTGVANGIAVFRK